MSKKLEHHLQQIMRISQNKHNRWELHGSKNICTFKNGLTLVSVL